MRCRPFRSAVQSTFETNVFQARGVEAVNRYPAVFKPSPTVESFGSGKDLKYSRVAGLGPVFRGSIRVRMNSGSSVLTSPPALLYWTNPSRIEAVGTRRTVLPSLASRRPS